MSELHEVEKEKENEKMLDEAHKQSDIAKLIGEPDSAAEIKEIAKDHVEEDEEELVVVDTSGPVTDVGHQPGKKKRDTIIIDGKPVEPTCKYPDCEKEAIAQFKDDMKQSNELLCEKHLAEKENLFNTGNNAYQVRPLMTQNQTKFQKVKERITGKKSTEEKGNKKGKSK